MRVLITGSRTWTNTVPIRAALSELFAEHGTLTVMHGACGRGADGIAASWAAKHRGKVVEERWPANWALLGKRAGMVRNADMVKAGADLCLAFIRDGSKGASHCARIAAAAGIETRIQRWEA